MLTDYLGGIEKKLASFTLKFSSEDILRQPSGQVLIIPVFEEEDTKDLFLGRVDRRLAGGLARKIKTSRFQGKEGEYTVLSPSDFAYETVIVIGLGKRKQATLPSLQKNLARALRYLAGHHLTSAAFSLDPTPYGPSLFEISRFLAEAFFLTGYQFDRYKSEKTKKKTSQVTALTVYLPRRQKNLDQCDKGAAFGRIVAKGVYLSRDLVNEPADHMHPETLVKTTQAITKASQGKVVAEVLDEVQCRRLGMGAFLGVAQGSERPPRFIIIKMKKGKEGKRQKICLIGKSITFDSGGLSLKPSEAMETMKIDMAGGATVLAVFKVMADLSSQKLINDFAYDLYGILPACENMPSGKALRPGDIVTALNGMTIEVLNTDAEGRVALADALSYAEKYLQPDYLIDLATLTGAIMIALGEEMTGLFGNNQTLVDRVLAAARGEGEAIWPMPLYQDYLSKMKSDLADLKNVAAGRYGGAITGALFLSEFVKKETAWAHLDIAGVSYNSGEVNGLLAKGATGWGVRTLVRLLTSKL